MVLPFFSPRYSDSVIAGLEQAQNLAGKDIRRPISDPFSRCRVWGKLSQIVKAIRRKRIADGQFQKRRGRRARGYRRETENSKGALFAANPKQLCGGQ